MVESRGTTARCPGSTGPFAWLTTGPGLVSSVAVAVLALRLSTSGLYGLFVDELYFLACGEHLAWGYVDMPPLTALQAWLTRTLFGDSMLSIRLFPSVAGALLVLVVGDLTRRLGGGRLAQLLAALATALSPAAMALNSFLSMNSVEPLIWTGMAWALVRILDGEPRWWLLFGAVAGLGLLNKHTVAVYGFALVAGILLIRRRGVLFTPWLAGGAAIAFLLFLPNLLWMVERSFPHLEQLENIRSSGRNVEGGPLFFVGQQLIFTNPLSAPLWLSGIAWLAADREGRRYRPLAWAYPFALVLLILGHGRVHYLTSIYPALMAAGAVAMERWLSGARLALMIPAYTVVLTASNLVLAPLYAPLLPPETYVTYTRRLGLEMPRLENRRGSALTQIFADRFGWPEMVAEVARVYHALPPEERRRCAIYCQDYGEAGAVDFYGPRLGLPKAISGHLSYWYWGPREYSGEVVIVLGNGREALERQFEDVRSAGRVGHVYAMGSQHFDLFVCRKPRGWTLQSAWPRVKSWG